MRVRTGLIVLFTLLTTITAMAADTQPPTMTRPVAKPDVLTPNGELVTVAISVSAHDDVDPNPRCTVRSVWSEQEIKPDDWKITGELEVALRAMASGEYDRVYNVVVVCSDSSGNEVGDSARVVVTAQQTPKDNAPVILKLAASPNVLSPPNNEMVPVKIAVEVTDDFDPKPRCTVTSVWSEQQISAEDWRITGELEVALRATADGDRERAYNVVVVCTDSAGNAAGDSARVSVPPPETRKDNPPVILRLTASPDTLTPPNDEMVPVKIAVEVTDDFDPKPRCTVTNVWSEQQISAEDWRITGELDVALRATASGDQTRVYNVVVVCTDSAGNAAGDSARVSVPPPETRTDNPPMITKLTASPDTLSPANDEMVPVKIDVEVVDDHDPQPRCMVTNVWSEQTITSDDWKITGALEVSLRASAKPGQDRIYNVVVVCSDSAGNQAGDAARVRVPAPEGSGDTTAPVLITLAAVPNLLAATNEMTPVKLEVVVMDNVDPQPRCVVTTVFANQEITENDWKITGDLEVSLRASATGGQDRVYSIAVVCTDFSGNASGDVTTVRVTNTSQSTTLPSTPPPPTKRRSSRS